MEKFRTECKDLVSKIDITVDLLVKQNMEEAIQELLNLIDNLTKVIDFLFLNKDELIKLGIVVDEKNMIEKLNEIVEALNNTDFVLVADLLNFEIKDIFTNYIEQLK